MTRIVVFALLAGVIQAALLWAAADHVITQKDRAFSQTELTIHAGDSVTFKNGDEVVHNVFSTTDGMAFDIRRQAPGGSSTVPFPKAGIAEVRCSIHPKMKLIVTVK
jgi:plastocyanin